VSIQSRSDEFSADLQAKFASPLFNLSEIGGQSELAGMIQGNQPMG